MDHLNIPFLYPSKPTQIYNWQTILDSIKLIDGSFKNWRFQCKKNGCRALVWIGKEKIVIMNRIRQTLTTGLEKNWDVLRDIFPVDSLLDGELIGRKQGEISNKLYLWDAPILGGENFKHVAYQSRHNELLKMIHNSKFVSVDSNDQTVIRFPDKQIGVATSYELHQLSNFIDVLRNREERVPSTGENEGVVIKKITCDMSWDMFRTKVISQQYKFLMKYGY